MTSQPHYGCEFTVSIHVRNLRLVNIFGINGSDRRSNMEGPKRLPFTTLGPTEKPEKKSAIAKTHRLELKIPDPSDATCPEFFYSDLIKTIPGAVNKSLSVQPNPDDTFGDDDPEKLAAIARAFEEKYNKPGEGKKKKKKWQDDYYLQALGDGYDESDTFIDNSEAYDEVLPETHTTKLGGFYINSGSLELKEMSDSEDEFRSPLPVKTKKKRRISSDEDSQGEPVKKKKIKDTLSADGEAKPKKKKKIIAPGEKGFKKPKLLDKNKDGKSPNVSALIKSTSPNLNGVARENGIHSPDYEDGAEAKNQMKSNISMVIDSVVAMAANSDSVSQGEFEESTPKRDIDPESIPKLPTNLPQGMEEKIQQLKDFAKKSSDGKCKFFTEDVNKLLLEVEMASKQMTVGNRSLMFGHLAAYLPCSKDTLLKRAKLLRVKELEDKIKGPLEKLKQAVNRMMPALQEKFDEECKKAAQEKLEEGNKEGVKEDKEKEKDMGKEDAGTDLSDEDEKTNPSEASKKRQTGPRKKFTWDSEIRSLLCDVVQVKMQTYAISKGKSQSAEEFCKSFLEQDVRPIWPKGWMQTRVLYKESRLGHMQWTNPQKPKQQSMMIKKVQVIPGAVPISKTPTSSVMSAPNSAKISSNNVPKNNSAVVKATSVTINSYGKPVVTSQITSTPVSNPKKIVPTILDYASNSGSSVSNSLSLLKSSSQGGGNLPSPTVINVSDMNIHGNNSKQKESSWNHQISDILRASISDHLSGKSPPKPVVNRQNSNPTTSPSSASGFNLQFAKFIGGDSTGILKQISPPQKYQESASLISEQHHNALLQQKRIQQQQIEAEKQRQIQMLKAEHDRIQSKVLQEKQKQSEAKHFASAQQSGFSQQQGLGSGDHPRMLGQSPMSMAMSKNIPAAGSSSRKQLVDQFQTGSSQSGNLMDNFIRQQLNDNSQGSPILNQGKTVQKTSQNQARGPYVQVSPTGEILRKSTSPQSRPVKNTHNSSPQSQAVRITQNPQGKTPSPHVVTLQRQSSQGQSMYSPATTSITPNSQPASNLLKSFLGQAQSQTGSGSMSGLGLQGAHSQGTPSPTAGSSKGPPKKEWATMSVQDLQERLMSAATVLKKPYALPVTSAQPIPGYQSVTADQLHAYTVQQQQMRAPPGSNLFTKQMSTPGSQKPPSADLQHYNSMQHYGYHGYGDGNK